MTMTPLNDLLPFPGFRASGWCRLVGETSGIRGPVNHAICGGCDLAQRVRGNRGTAGFIEFEVWVAPSCRTTPWTVLSTQVVPMGQAVYNKAMRTRSLPLEFGHDEGLRTRSTGHLMFWHTWNRGLQSTGHGDNSI